MKKIGFVVFLLVFAIIFHSLVFVSASPFIAGFVNDSFDGESANGLTISLWNPINGLNDNLTDVIGTSGNSGADNFYMFDCGLLETPCDIGDTLTIKVFSDGNGHESKSVNVSVTGAGFEIAQSLMINSKPNVTLITPMDYSNVSGQIIFNCSAFDFDGNLASISLYTNFTGSFVLNETKIVTGFNNSTTFTKIPSDGRYTWACRASDDMNLFNQSFNRSVIFDNRPPNVYSLYTNESRSCGLSATVRVNCNTSDSLSGVFNVIIQATSNVSSLNYSASFAGNGIYFADVLLNQYGSWDFTCISNDSASNLNRSNYTFGGVFQNLANLIVETSSMVFSKQNPVEDEQVVLNVSVSNVGCTNVSNFTLGFYEGDPSFGGLQIGLNRTGNVSGGSNIKFNLTWQSKIGINNIYAVADINNSINESDENDNKANKSINVVSWHLFYGNITADRILANSGFYNLTLWLNDSNSSGNVYVSDTESEINWASLIAFGRNKSNVLSSNDFAEIDSILGSTSYLDSISNTYTSNGNNPRNTTSFLVSNNFVNNVPIINTTSSYNFFTGILWDSSDDSNGEYDSLEKEDVVFITNINRNSLGSQGIYDYELSVPSKLREYNSLDSSEVYIYFDLN